MEAARMAAVREKRANSQVLTPDLHALILAFDACRRAHDFPPHTPETFLHNLQMRALHPQAAHQNEAPKEHTEQDLHRHHFLASASNAITHCLQHLVSKGTTSSTGGSLLPLEPPCRHWASLPPQRLTS
jgi:hypothetical protein